MSPCALDESSLSIGRVKPSFIYSFILCCIFLKNAAGVSCVPNVIGGRDLEVYNRSLNKDLEDWFTREKEVSSLTLDYSLILKEMIFIASISTYVPLYCISTTGNHIILKACIRLDTIKRQYEC